MADKKMNEFATASDGAYIYAESASGEQIKISKADLASVVAELLSLSMTVADDINTICFSAPIGLSVYSVISATKNSPLSVGGILLNISRYIPVNTYSVIFQLLIPAEVTDQLMYRTIHVISNNVTNKEWSML